MKEPEDNNLCSNGGELLGYLYSEMPTSDRENFELHLAGCNTCIDDFAELSQGRFPVFEWKSLEFDALPTPRFVVPEHQAHAGVMQRLRVAFLANRTFAIGGSAAVFLVAVFAAYTFYFQSVSEADIAVAGPASIDSPTQNMTLSSLPVEIDPTAGNEINEQNSAVSQKALPKRPARGRSILSKSKPTLKERPPLNVKASVQRGKQVTSIPVFSVAEDDEDETLRLADILDEIDAS